MLSSDFAGNKPVSEKNAEKTKLLIAIMHVMSKRKHAKARVCYLLHTHQICSYIKYYIDWSV